MVARSSLESFSSQGAPGGDASHTLVHGAYEGLLGPRGVASIGETPEYNNLVKGATAGVTPSDSTGVPAGVDAGAWQQVKDMIAKGNDVQFTSAADNQNGAQPDYFLTPDGKLVHNDAKPPVAPGDKVNIQVQGKDTSPAAQQFAKDAAKQLQVAAVNEKIAYWMKNHPDQKEAPDFLKGELATAQNNAGGLARDDQAYSNLKFPEVQSPQAAAGDIPQDTTGAGPGSDSPGGGARYASNDGGGPSGPGGPGGGSRPGADYHGLDNPGTQSPDGKIDGNFNPDAKIDASAIPKPVAGDMSILIDPAQGPSATPQQIQAFLEKAHCPAASETVDGKSFAQNLYDACIARNLDPGAAVGFFLKESTLGTKGAATHNNSIGNIKVSKGYETTDGTYRHYHNWSEGARDWAKLIDENYVHKRGLTTLVQILQVYQEGSPQAYASTVKGVVEGFRRDKQRDTAVASADQPRATKQA